MKLEDIDYKFLLNKYKKLGISKENIERRLKLIDPDNNLRMIYLTLSPPCF